MGDWAGEGKVRLKVLRGVRQRRRWKEIRAKGCGLEKLQVIRGLVDGKDGSEW